jgi:predicted CXXCH cytochrome family protein
MFSGKFRVHAPVGLGQCTSCHNPHASPSEKLVLDQVPSLCFRCHLKSKFEGKEVVHVPVIGGMCLVCHEPHQSDTKKILVQKLPDLCFNCHDRSAFTKRVTHSVVTAGLCPVCHEPHISERDKLLIKSVKEGCIECHPWVAQQPHAIRAFKKDGHPIESKRTVVVGGKKIRLSCISCHDAHSSDWIKRFKYPANSAFELCNHCHKK